MSPIRSISLSLSRSALLCRPTRSVCIYVPPPSPSLSLSLPRPSDWRLDVVPKSVDCHRLTLCIMGWKMPIILLPNVSAKFRACVRGRDTATFFVSNQRSCLFSVFVCLREGWVTIVARWMTCPQVRLRFFFLISVLGACFSWHIKAARLLLHIRMEWSLVVASCFALSVPSWHVKLKVVKLLKMQEHVLCKRPPKTCSLKGWFNQKWELFHHYSPSCCFKLVWLSSFCWTLKIFWRNPFGYPWLPLYKQKSTPSTQDFSF